MEKVDCENCVELKAFEQIGGGLTFIILQCPRCKRYIRLNDESLHPLPKTDTSTDR